MGSSLQKVIQIDISHPCLSAGIGLDSAARHPCVFTAATGSCMARGDLLWEQMLLSSLPEGAPQDFIQVGPIGRRMNHYFGYPFTTFSQSRGDLTAGTFELIHFQPYQQSLFQETDYMARQNQCHFVVTCCEQSISSAVSLIYNYLFEHLSI